MPLRREQINGLKESMSVAPLPIYHGFEIKQQL